MLNPVSGQSLRVELFCNGKSLSTATAFAVLSNAGDAYLVSNRHVFSGVNTLTGKLLCDDGSRPTHIKVWHTATTPGPGSGWGEYWIPVTYGLVGKDFCPTWFEHSTDPRIDLAVLPIPSWDKDPRAPKLLLQPCELNDPPSLDKVALSVTTELSVVGYPFGVSASNTPIWIRASIASEPALDYRGRPSVLVDCRARPGSSGSPVVVSRQGPTPYESGVYKMGVGRRPPQLVGIYSGRISTDSDLGIVWKVSALRELLTAVPPWSPADVTIE